MISKIPMQLLGKLIYAPRLDWGGAFFEFVVDLSSSPLPDGEEQITCHAGGGNHRVILLDCHRGTQLLIHGLLVVDFYPDPNGINRSMIFNFEVDKLCFVQSRKAYGMLNRLKRGWPVRRPLLDVWHRLSYWFMNGWFSAEEMYLKLSWRWREWKFNRRHGRLK